MTLVDVQRARAVRASRAPLVAIPAYNEDRFIGSLVLKLRAGGYDVLVVDDGSTDQTAAVAEAAGARVLRHADNEGKAAAVRTTFTYAREHEVEALVLMDGDSQHDPAEVAQVAAPVLEGRADMVVGSRFAGAHNAIPRWRVFGQHLLTAATNVGSGLKTTDSQSGFRAFSRRAIGAMHFVRAGFSVESEMQFEARASGLTVEEVPITVHYEEPSKRNPLSHGLNVVDAVLRLVAQHRPLLFFTVPGLVILLTGLILGVYVVRIYDASAQLAVGYALVTVLLSTIGMLGMSVGIILHAMRSMLLNLSRRRPIDD